MATFLVFQAIYRIAIICTRFGDKRREMIRHMPMTIFRRKQLFIILYHIYPDFSIPSGSFHDRLQKIYRKTIEYFNSTLTCNWT